MPLIRTSQPVSDGVELAETPPEGSHYRTHDDNDDLSTSRSKRRAAEDEDCSVSTVAQKRMKPVAQSSTSNGKLPPRIARKLFAVSGLQRPVGKTGNSDDTSDTEFPVHGSPDFGIEQGLDRINHHKDVRHGSMRHLIAPEVCAPLLDLELTLIPRNLRACVRTLEFAAQEFFPGAPGTNTVNTSRSARVGPTGPLALQASDFARSPHLHPSRSAPFSFTLVRRQNN
ncbi:hypothetical protein C8R45DRAFT_942760 [Mycena sanguinolenta]|nr:hypothetical protein C8R45DRAFT_942760 [Mycena sanguinolenta]